MQLQQPHVGRMETRPPNVEGKGEIRQRELVKNALRMRPDRIILGECRGEEAFDMLQAMNTGHEGSMATIHANTPRDAISRLEQMIGMAGLPMTVASIRSQIANAVQLIVQLQRQSDGKRKVTSIAEVTGLEGDIIQMQEIFKFVRTGTARQDSARALSGDRRASALPGSSRQPGHQDSRQLFRSLAAALNGHVRFQFNLSFYILIGLSAAMFAEGVYLLVYNNASYRKNINRRLKVMSDKSDRESVLVQLRRTRPDQQWRVSLANRQSQSPAFAVRSYDGIRPADSRHRGRRDGSIHRRFHV